MKKLCFIFLFIVVFAIALTGCAKNYSPKQLGEYGEVYKSTDLDIDGSNSVINISKISKTDGSVIVDIGAPTADQVAWAYKKFMYFNLEDEKGSIINISKISLSQSDDKNVEVRFTLTCDNVNNCKYLEIGTYKMSNGDILIFKL